MTVIELVLREIQNDDEDASDKLVALYADGSAAEKDIIDRTMVCICGWTLPTLMSKAAQETV